MRSLCNQVLDKARTRSGCLVWSSELFPDGAAGVAHVEGGGSAAGEICAGFLASCLLRVLVRKIW